ncbi:MAG: DUF6766 family protein [Ornithinibacter sp.]
MADTTMRATGKPAAKHKGNDEAGRRKVERMLSDNGSKGKPRFPKAYGFGIVTLGLFVLSWTGQFFMQLAVVRNESSQHGQPFEWPDFLAQFFSSTFENWQSEFLQLVWQAAGLTLLLFWGSSQSKESDERIEVKIDRLLEEQGIDPASISARVNRTV